MKPFESDNAGRKAIMCTALCVDQRHGAVHAMATAGKQLKAEAGLCLAFRFGQDTTASGNHCVAGQDKSVRMPGRHGSRLFVRQTASVNGGQLVDRKRTSLNSSH